MADQDLTTTPEHGFIEQHFPHIYKMWIRTTGIFIPDPELRYDLVKEMVKTQNLEQIISSLHQDYHQAKLEAWQTQQELNVEQGANQIREQRFQEIAATNQHLQQEKDSLLQRLTEVTQNYNTLEQQLQSNNNNNNKEILHQLQQEHELRELLTPENPDDFEYRCAAARIYTPLHDSFLEPELENAFLASLEKKDQTKRYQKVTLHIADKLFSNNFPKTAASLYNTLLKYFNSEKYHPLSQTETTAQSIQEIQHKLTTRIETQPEYVQVIFEIANLNQFNQQYNLAQQLGIVLAKATNNDEYRQFIEHVTSELANQEYDLGKQKMSTYEQQPQPPSETLLIKAIEHFTIALKMKPDELLLKIQQDINKEKYIPLITQQAKTLRDQKKWKETQPLFEFLTIIEPTNHNHHYFLATIYEQTNQLENARTEYQTAGTGSSAKAGLARIEQKLHLK